MLQNLYIKNIALISELNLSFESDLSVLTGETGAGKSIIIDALAFVLGSRADKSLIKTGSDRAFVEAVFSVETDGNAAKLLNELGFEDESECVLSRSMTESGKNETRINGRITTISILKQLSGLLVDIFGQNEQTYLLKKETHLDILDGFRKDDGHLQAVSEGYKQLKAIRQKLSQFGGDNAERLRTIGILEHQIAEIEAADWKENEEEQLLQFRKKAQHALQVAEAMTLASQNLERGEFSTLVTVSNALRSLTAVSGFDAEYEELRKRLESCKYELQDIAAAVSDSLLDLDFNPAEADRAEDRLDVIKDLKRKYGATFQAVQEFLQKSRQQCADLQNAEETVSKLLREKEVLLDGLYDASCALTQMRKQAADKLEQRICSELNDLSMKDAVFKVAFSNAPSRADAEKYVSDNGWDSVEFLFSANKGEPAKPLSKIASGGEMSRFMLAVKNITAQIESIPTMIFDEIDSGISGRVASAVAQKLANISRGYQAVVITHLPQIACMGDVNYLVEKNVSDGKTSTTVRKLDAKGKQLEIQRLIGGQDAGQFGGLHAQDMINAANGWKQSL